MTEAHLDFKRANDGTWLTWCRGAWRQVLANGRCALCGTDVSSRLKP